MIIEIFKPEKSLIYEFDEFEIRGSAPNTGNGQIFQLYGNIKKYVNDKWVKIKYDKVSIVTHNFNTYSISENESMEEWRIRNAKEEY